MKMKALAFSLAAAAMMSFSACGDKTPQPVDQKQQQIQANNNLPMWIIDPSVEGGIAAVGVAGYSKHGMQVMLPQAEMDARAKLAGKIQTEVSRIQESVMRANQINDMDNFEKAFRQGSAEVVKKIPLSGAKKINHYQAPDGTFYVHMVIQKREVANSIEDMKDIYKEQMEQAHLTRESIDEGMKVLDDMMGELREATE